MEDTSELRPNLRYAPEHLKARVPLLLRKTAIEIAAAFYDMSKRSKAFRVVFPSQRKYVENHWPEFIKQAREALLSVMEHSKSDHVRNEIYDAITNNFEERTKNSFKGISNG